MALRSEGSKRLVGIFFERSVKMLRVYKGEDEWLLTYTEGHDTRPTVTQVEGILGEGLLQGLAHQ